MIKFLATAWSKFLKDGEKNVPENRDVLANSHFDLLTVAVCFNEFEDLPKLIAKLPIKGEQREPFDDI